MRMRLELQGDVMWGIEGMRMLGTQEVDMSRSGYSYDGDDDWSLIRWRGAVASAIRGRRGQSFLREMLSALDAMPEKKLIAHELEREGAVCALGALGKARGIDMAGVDPEDSERVASLFGISDALAKETVWVNDEEFDAATPEQRFQRVREWVRRSIQGT